MYRKILVGYDDSDQAKDALALGKQLADATGAELSSPGVFQWDPVWHDCRLAFPRRGRRVRAPAEGRCEAVGAEVKPRRAARRRVGCTRWQRRLGADLILVGSRASRTCRPDSRGQRRSRAASWRAVRRRHRAERLPRTLEGRHRIGGRRFRRLGGIGPCAHRRGPPRGRGEAAAKLVSVAEPPPIDGRQERDGRLARDARGDPGGDAQPARRGTPGRSRRHRG